MASSGLSAEEIARLTHLCRQLYSSNSLEERKAAEAALAAFSIVPQNFEPFIDLFGHATDVYLLQFTIQSLRRILIRYHPHLQQTHVLLLGRVVLLHIDHHVADGTIQHSTLSSLSVLFGTIVRFYWQSSSDVRALVEVATQLLYRSIPHCNAACILLSELIEEIGSHRLNSIAAASSMTSITLTRTIATSFGTQTIPTIALSASYVLFVLLSHFKNYQTSQIYLESGHEIATYPRCQAASFSDFQAGNCDQTISSLISLLLHCIRFDFSSLGRLEDDDVIMFPTPSQWKPLTNKNFLLLMIIFIANELTRQNPPLYLASCVDLLGVLISLKPTTWQNSTDRFIGAKYVCNYAVILLSLLTSTTPNNSRVYFDEHLLFQSASSLLHCIFKHFSLLDIVNIFHPLIPCSLYFDQDLYHQSRLLLEGLQQACQSNEANLNIEMLLGPKQPCREFQGTIFGVWLSRLFLFTVQVYNIGSDADDLQNALAELTKTFNQQQHQQQQQQPNQQQQQQQQPQGQQGMGAASSQPTVPPHSLPFLSLDCNPVEVMLRIEELGDLTVDELFSIHRNLLQLWSSLATAYSTVCPDSESGDTSSKYSVDDSNSPESAWPRTTSADIKTRMFSRRFAINPSTWDFVDLEAQEHSPPPTPSHDIQSLILTNTQMDDLLEKIPQILPQVGHSYILALMGITGALVEESSFEDIVQGKIVSLDDIFCRNTTLSEHLHLLSIVCRVCPQETAHVLSQLYLTLKLSYTYQLSLFPGVVNEVTQQIGHIYTSQQSRNPSQLGDQFVQLVDAFTLLYQGSPATGIPLELELTTKAYLRQLYRIEAQMAVLLSIVAALLQPKNSYFANRNRDSMFLTTFHADISCMLWEAFRFYALRFGHLSLMSPPHSEFNKEQILNTPLDVLLSYLLTTPAITANQQLSLPLYVIPPSPYLSYALTSAVGAFIDSVTYRQYLTKPHHYYHAPHQARSFSQSLLIDTFAALANVMPCVSTTNGGGNSSSERTTRLHDASSLLVDPHGSEPINFLETLNAAMILAIHNLNIYSLKHNVHVFNVELSLAFLLHICTTISILPTLPQLPATRILTQHHHIISLGRVPAAVPIPSFPNIAIDLDPQNPTFVFPLPTCDSISDTMCIPLYYEVIARLTKRSPTSLTLPFDGLFAALGVYLEHPPATQTKSSDPSVFYRVLCQTIILVCKAISAAGGCVLGEHVFLWVGRYFPLLVRCGTECTSQLFSLRTGRPQSQPYGAGAMNRIAGTLTELSLSDGYTGGGASRDGLHDLSVFSDDEDAADTNSTIVRVNAPLSSALASIMQLLAVCAGFKGVPLLGLVEQAQSLIFSCLRSCDQALEKSSRPVAVMTDSGYINTIIAALVLVEKLVDNVVARSASINMDRVEDNLPSFFPSLLRDTFTHIHKIPLTIMVSYVELSAAYLNLLNAVTRSIIPVFLTALPDEQILHSLAICLSVLESHHHLQLSHPLFYLTQFSSSCLYAILSYSPRTAPSVEITSNDAFLHISAQHIHPSYYRFLTSTVMKTPIVDSIDPNKSDIIFNSRDVTSFASIFSYLQTHNVNSLLPAPVLDRFITHNDDSMPVGSQSSIPQTNSEDNDRQQRMDIRGGLQGPDLSTVPPLDAPLVQSVFASDLRPTPLTSSQTTTQAIIRIKAILQKALSHVPVLRQCFHAIMGTAIFDGPENTPPCIFKIIPYWVHFFPALWNEFSRVLVGNVNHALCNNLQIDVALATRRIEEQTQIVQKYCHYTVCGKKTDEVMQITVLGGTSVISLGALLDTSVSSVLKSLATVVVGIVNKPTQF